MAHARQQVREAAKAKLAAIPGLTVVDNIAAHVTEDLLPAAIVSTPAEETTAPAADQQGAGNLSLRDVTLLVVLLLDGETGEDEIDELAVQIEAAFSDDLGGLARFVAPVAEMSYTLDRMQDEDGQLWLTFAEFEFSVGVVTTLGDAEAVL